MLVLVKGQRCASLNKSLEPTGVEKTPWGPVCWDRDTDTERQRNGTGPTDQWILCKNFQQVLASEEHQLIWTSSGGLKRIGSRIREHRVQRETVDIESMEMNSWVKRRKKIEKRKKLGLLGKAEFISALYHPSSLLSPASPPCGKAEEREKMLTDESFQMNQSYFAQPSLYARHHPCRSLLRQVGIYICSGGLMPFQRKN